MGKSKGTANSNAIQLHGRRKEPEELLWIAVLSKAADDALFTTDYREALLAINWFEGEGRDFRYVCQLANRDHLYVLKKILKLVNETFICFKKDFKTSSRKKEKDKRMGRRNKTENRWWYGKKSCHLVFAKERKRKC